MGWRASWAEARFRVELALTGVALVGVMTAQAAFMAWNEVRPGAVLDDPVLELFTPRDLSIVTFAIIYASLVFGLAVLMCRPPLVLRAVQAYVVIVAVRIAMMAVTPLEPPPEIIPLRDPVVELATSGAALTRDLFFSGHTATVLLLAFAAPRRGQRALLAVAGAAVALLTVRQHAHYVVDVLVAPFVAYGCWRLCGLWRPPVPPGRLGAE